MYQKLFAIRRKVDGLYVHKKNGKIVYTVLPKTTWKRKEDLTNHIIRKKIKDLYDMAEHEIVTFMLIPSETPLVSISISDKKYNKTTN